MRSLQSIRSPVPRKETKISSIPKAVFAELNVAVMISNIHEAVPFYSNLVNSIRHHDALALLDEADKGFDANQRQISDWLAQHGR